MMDIEAYELILIHKNLKRRVKKADGTYEIVNANETYDEWYKRTVKEQEHKKNMLHIQQQKRLEEGSLDSKNIAEAKQRKEAWIEKDKNIWTEDYFLQMIKQADAKRKAKPVLKNEMPDKFTESNSLSDAVDFMKVYSKYDKHEVDDSFKLDIINGFNESAYNVKKRYGRDLDISGIERMPEGRRDQAAYSSTSKKITLKNSNLSTLKKNANKNYESDWNASDDVYSVFYHEIGHSVWEDLSLSAQFEITTLYKDTKKAVYDEWVSIGGKKSMLKQEDIFGMQLSRYGAKNEKEFFSEAFTQIMSNIDSDIAKKIDDILMRKYADKSIVNYQQSDRIISGAISGARNPYSEKAHEHAKRYYDEIRKRKTDVEKISTFTGYSTKDIQIIKDYLFIDKHDLGEYGVKRFDPDYMIAESWRRLSEGKPEKHDLTLLNHEMLEKELITKGKSQRDAHIIATQKYNYEKEANEFYGKIKKYKKE